MALAEVKEPPPKPTRIRAATTTTTSPSKSTSPGTTAMIITQPPALSKTPIPLSRPAPRIPVSAPNPAPLAPAEPGKGPSLVETAREEKQDLIAARKKKLLPLPEPGIPSKTTAPLSLSTNQGSVDGIKGAVASKAPRDAIQRASSAPMPPPKPKRISLAPQPKAKPLSLQSIPLQPKVEASTRATTAPATAAMSSSPPATPNSIPNVMQSQETTKPKTPSNSVLASPTQPVLPPAKKPRSAEHPTDGCLIPADSESLQQRFKSQMRTVPSSSPPPSMSMSHPNIGAKTTPLTPEKTSDSAAGTNPTLIGARSRLRSTSDAKAATSLAVAIPYTAMNHAANTSSLDDSTGFGFADSRGYAGALVSPTFPSPTFRRNGSYDDDADDGSSGVVAAERLAASLHKIQVLAQGQTERMKQINYAEKRADLAEVVQEKSSLWRARGAEWGGIAKKAWEDRGGMGGIAGGIADRWKRRGDGMNDGAPYHSRPGASAVIFGLSLEEAVRVSKISASTGVPAIVTRCIEYLDIMGVEEIGLYRVSGSTTNVNRLKTIFDGGDDYDFLQKGNEPQNPHDVATLLKLYLRELPSPIIPFDIMPTFSSIDFSESDQQPAQKLKDALRLLPLENYILLATLCQHLSNLADYENYTKMNISNLGLIFCPTLQIGSVLFKNLLGGDGGEEDRRKCLLAVWDDLAMKREEMENLEMIKDFEMGLQFEKNGDRAFIDDSSRERERERELQLQQQEKAQGHDLGRQSWEEIDRDLLNLSSSPPPQTTIASSPFRPMGSSGSKPLSSIQNTHWSGEAFDTSTVKPSEPPLDLYDEMMKKELTEATNTPLIDLSAEVEDPETMDPRWRRHAREPAMNRRSESPPNVRVARHERLPAVSLRY